jgi:hypothetical protein
MNSLRGADRAQGVRIILQDPSYTPKDKILLTEENSKGPLSFATDLVALLEIGTDTIVIKHSFASLLSAPTNLCRPGAAGCVHHRSDQNRYDKAYV